MKKKPSRVVWDSDYGKISDWQDFLEEEGILHAPEHIQHLAILKLNADYLDDERANLSINVPTGIVVVADCGIWNGHTIQSFEAGNNLANCLDFGTTGVSDGSFRWYVDRYGNFRCDAEHHDGTNHIVYRTWKPQLSKARKQQFFRDMILAGKYDSAIVGKYTMALGKLVSNVYGW